MEYPEDFLKAVNDLIDKWEGGYVNDAHDPGGETNMGISKRSYPHEDIKDLTRDEAIAIYWRDFWEEPKIDQLGCPADFGCDEETLRGKVFNMGVLMGPGMARTLLIGCHSLDEYRQACKIHFEAIVMRHPVCARYLKGWTRRALA